MKKGINRALNNIYESFNEQKNFASKKKPCIFLSHRSLDKDMVEQIGKYIMNAGIDIYLDKYDEELQRADKEGDDTRITKCIQNGIEKSTHIMCLLSHSTIESWWVPYEIGYGEKSNKEICSLKLKELSEESIPSYIKVNTCLKGMHDLNDYVQQVIKKYSDIALKSFSKYENKKYEIFNDASIIEESYSYHPLKDYLDQ